MSANFFCWLPILGLIPSSPDFSAKIEKLQEAPHSSPSPVVVEFVDDLLKRYPEQTAKIESVWADAPLKSDITGQFIDMGILWSRYSEAVPFIVSTAHHFRLNCYDPQDSRYYLAKNSD